jgi:hypothetical protein
MSAYFRYKESTDVFTSWICISAADHGSEVTTSRPIDPVQARAGKRPNGGKARRKWKADREAAAAANHANSTADGRPIYLVSSEEILKQAEFLSKLTDTIIMPRPVWQAFKQALAGRKMYAKRYAKEVLGEDEEEDGHIAFIRILEESAEYIKKIAQVQQVASASSLDSKLMDTTLANLFGSLNFIEEAEEEEPHIAPAEITETYKPKKLFVIKVDKASDIRLQRHFLLEQAAKEGQYLQMLWDKSDQGEVHPALAAFLTEAAIELFGEKERELVEQASEIGGSIVSEIDPDFHSPIEMALISLRDIRAARQIYPGYTFPLAPLIERHPYIQHAQALQADTFLVQFMMDLGLETSLRDGIWGNKDLIVKVGLEEPLLPSSCDIISRILMVINKGAEPTLQAAFAAAILQDLATRRYSPAEEPIQLLLNTCTGLDKRLRVIGDAGTVVVNENKQLAEQLRTLRDWVGVFPYRALHNEKAAERKAPHLRGYIAASDEPFSIRGLHPVSCGKMRLALFMLYSELGMSTMNYSPHVFSMCYLVHALQYHKLLAGSWKTIEYVSEHFRKEIFISEDLPSTTEATLTRMRLATGVSLVHIATMQRARLSGRKVPATSHTSRSDRNWDLHAGKLIAFLRDYMHQRESLLRTLHAMDAEIQKSTGAWSPFLEHGTVSFLEALQPALMNAFDELNKDYLTLDSACRALFRKMDLKMSDSQVGVVDPSDSWNTHSIRSYQIAIAVISELREVEQIRERVGKPSLQVPTPLADVAQKVLDSYIKSGAVGIPK